MYMEIYFQNQTIPGKLENSEILKENTWFFFFLLLKCSVI